MVFIKSHHPKGNATDDDIEVALKQRKSPPLRKSPITAHLSSSAIDVIEKCIEWDPSKRITALELLRHPWVVGLTAREDKMADASKKLSMFREFKTKLEAKGTRLPLSSKLTKLQQVRSLHYNQCMLLNILTKAFFIA